MSHQNTTNQQEKSEFDDKIVKDYRIIKPIGKLLVILIEFTLMIGQGKFSVVFKA
jgi:hypothetical protein